MINLDIVGFMLRNAKDLHDDSMVTAAREKGYDEGSIKEAMDAIDRDEIIVVSTLWFLTPISPIIYRLGVRKVSIERRVLWGLFRNNTDVGIRAIDNAKISERIVSASVTITHSDQSEVLIDKITKSDARKIEQFFGSVIEAQRSNVVNIASD